MLSTWWDAITFLKEFNTFEKFIPIQSKKFLEIKESNDLFVFFTQLTWFVRIKKLFCKHLHYWAALSQLPFGWFGCRVQTEFIEWRKKKDLKSKLYNLCKCSRGKWELHPLNWDRFYAVLRKMFGFNHSQVKLKK